MNATSTRRHALALSVLAAAVALAGITFPATAEETSLAIKGYDPVAYFTLGKPTKGPGVLIRLG
jgi:hypothetical protein